MEIKGEHRIAASRDVVWAALNDPQMLEKCIPGCQSLEKLSDTELHARIKAVIGPVRTSFNTKITLEDIYPPESYTIVGEAKAGATGFGRGSAVVTLEEVEAATHLHYTADFKVGGKLAQVGSRLVVGATRKTADEFFSALSSHIDPGAANLHEEAPIPASSSKTKTWLALSALLALLILWFLLR